jgi:hypothetical protein
VSGRPRRSLSVQKLRYRARGKPCASTKAFELSSASRFRRARPRPSARRSLAYVSRPTTFVLHLASCSVPGWSQPLSTTSHPDMGKIKYRYRTQSFPHTARGQEQKLKAIESLEERGWEVAEETLKGVGNDVMNQWCTCLVCEPMFMKKDPVLCTRNMWDRGLQNGSLGIIVEIDEVRRTLTNDDGTEADHALAWVLWDDGLRRAVVEAMLDDLELGYAITVHKAQGSQWPRVIVPLTGHRLLDRTLIYTAVTRAQRQVLIVGDEAAAKAAVESARGCKAGRWHWTYSFAQPFRIR